MDSTTTTATAPSSTTADVGHRGYKNLRGVDLRRTTLSEDDSPVVVVATSSVELVHWVQARREHHPGVIPIIVPPTGQQGLAVIADAVLSGIGKDHDLSPLTRSAELTATGWLTYGTYTDAIIVDAQKLSGWLLPEVVTWLQAFGIRPWFIYTSVNVDGVDNTADITQFTADLIDAWDADTATIEQTRAAFPDRPGADSTAPARQLREALSPLPRLPRCDGIVFRQQCATLLTEPDRSRVDERFKFEVADTLRAFAEAIASPDRQKGRQIHPHLRQRIERAHDTEDVILAVRAAQVAALRVGWNLTVDPVRLIAAAELRPRPGDVTHPYTWQRFDTYRDPDFGAAAALYVAGVHPSDLAEVTVGCFTHHDDGSLTVSGVAVTNPGTRFIKTLVLVRHLGGATSTDLLFKTHKNGPVSNKHIYGLLNAPKEHTNDAFVDLSHSRKLPTEDEWLARYGLQLQHLGSQPTRRRQQ